MSDPFGADERKRIREAERSTAALRKKHGMREDLSGSLAFSTWKRASPLKVWALEAGLTMTEVAKRSGLSVRSLHRWAAGDAVPTPRNLADVAGVLGVEPTTLWASHLAWLSFRPMLDNYGRKRANAGAMRQVHPVHRRMVELGLTREEVGERAGVTGRTIGNMWSNTTAPQADTVLKVAEALDLDPGKLLTDLADWSRTFTGLDPLEVLGVAAVYEREKYSD